MTSFEHPPKKKKLIDAYREAQKRGEVADAEIVDAQAEKRGEERPRNGAMTDALERARIKKIEKSLAQPAEEAPPAPEAQPEKPAPSTGDAFDADAYSKEIGDTYAALEKKSQEAGMQVPADAIEAYETVKELSKMYAEEKNPKRKEDFKKRIEKFGGDLKGVISKKVERKTGRPKKSSGKRAASPDFSKSAANLQKLFEAVSAKETSPETAEINPSQADEPIVPLTPMPDVFLEKPSKRDYITDQLSSMAKAGSAEVKPPQPEQTNLDVQPQALDVPPELEKLDAFFRSIGEPEVEATAPRIETEKTPEEIAEENRHEALGVPSEFEGKEFEKVKLSHDQIHQLLKKMSEDPEAAFSAEDAGFEYRVILPERDEQGNLTARWKEAGTYHDLLWLRATIPEDLRDESDKLVFDWKSSGKWGKMEVFSDTEKLWDRLNNPDDRLSKYKEEFYSLIDGTKNEQLPDEYAHAVVRGEVAPDTPPTATSPGGKIEPTLGEEPGQPQAQPAEKMTVGESHTLLERLIGGYKRALEGAKEKIDAMSERGAELASYSAGRIKELDAALAPKAEKLAEKIGEKYNKLPLWAKIATGGVLTLGLAGTMSVAWPLTSLFGGLIAVQRAAGMMGVFVNVDKHLQSSAEGTSQNFLGKRDWYQKLVAGRPEQDRKNMAAVAAMGWTFGMSAAIGVAAKELSETELAQQLQEWLRHHYPFGEAATPAATVDVSEKISPPVSEPPAGAVTPPAEAAAESAQSAARAAAGEAAATPELPSVQATPGKGYEYMVKRLWENLHSRGIALPEGVDPDSDLGQLLKIQPGDEAGINKLVHDLASDPERGFFNPDGTSVRIDLGSQMTVDADGNIRLNDMLKAPEGAPVTPIYPVEAPAVQLAAETPIVQQDLPRETVTSFEPKGGPDLTAEQDLAQKQIDAASEAAAQQPVTPPISERLVWKDSSGDIVRDGSGQSVYAGDFGEPAPVTEPEVLTPVEAVTPQPEAPEASVPAESATQHETAPPAEAPAQAPEAGADIKINASGLAVDVAHANAYLDAQGNMIIFGGTLEERTRAAFEIVAKDKSAVVYFDSSRSSGPFGLFTEHHISKAYWFEGSGNVETAPGAPPGEAVTIQQPVIVDDTTEPSLSGRGVPTINDLKEQYKPGSPKP